MNILLTGGAGYIGSHTSLLLIDKGHEVTIVDNLTSGNSKLVPKKANFINSDIADEKKNLVKNKDEIETNVEKKEFLVIDARSIERFEGKAPEPRKNVRSGSIKNSRCLPFNEIINKDHTFKKYNEILDKFNDILGSNNQKEIVFSCGSGVTAAVLALAYSLINNKYKPSIYDGSWAEYGKF